MPGMMDTVLNLGLNDRTVVGLAKKSGDERFAYDSYRRFIQMYAQVVLGIDHHHFEDVIERQKLATGKNLDTELTAKDWQQVVVAYKSLVHRELKQPFPQDPQAQLWGAIGAVFGSWMNQRAITYRRLHDIPADWGTAVNVQAMVFGNMGEGCATGVAFTRNPSTGANEFYGEFLINAQGEDVVAGIRTPQHLTIAGKKANGSDLPAMEEVMPDVFAQLLKVREALEAHYREMQDIEFTVQQAKLYMLQTRTGKRTAQAALKIAVDCAESGLISRAEAVRRIDPASLDQLLHPRLDPKAKKDILAKGLPASPGAACGIVVFSADEAEAHAARGEPVILVRIETSPEDIHGMHAAKGTLTTRGGMTSHAAVVARGMGRPCVAGAGELRIDYGAGTIAVRDRVVKAGAVITIDGSTGEVMHGEVPTLQPELSGDFATVMGWADEMRRMRVRANAETPTDARTARRFGAEGIGLCRTEHMFFDGDRIIAVREMIMAEDAEGRRKALAKLLPIQRQDFVDIYTHHARAAGDDPPARPAAARVPAEDRGGNGGSRGGDRARHRVDPPDAPSRCTRPTRCSAIAAVRLAITSPEIYDMQVRAIFEAAAKVTKETGVVDQAGNHDPAGRDQEGTRPHQGVDRPHRRRCRQEARAAKSRTWSAP